MQFKPTIIGVALAAGLIGPSTVADATEQRVYSGEALFEGLFLGRGPVAQHHGDLRVPTSSGTWTAEQAQDLINAIRKADPGFFTTFQRDITSGDRVRIERAAVAADKLAAGAPGGQGAPATPSAYATFIVVNETLVKQTNTIWDKNRVWGRLPGAASTLAKEMWVNDVAETLTP